MKTKYLGYAMLGLTLIGASSSCSEEYNIYSDDYATVVGIKNSGANSLTVYSAFETTQFPITVRKGGWNNEEAATFKVRVMSEAEFEAWRSASGAGYSYIPNNCYSIGGQNSLETAVTIPAGESYTTVNVDVYSEALGEFMKNADTSLFTPVIPVMLESEGSGVNADNAECFIIPEYTQPTVGFLNGGFHLIPNGESSFTLDLGLPFTSEWDLNCTVEVDPTLLEGGLLTYGLMPADAYTGVGSVQLNKGDESAEMTINIDMEKAGFRNAIPLRITTLDREGFVLRNETAIVAIDNAAPYKIAMRADMVYSNDGIDWDGQGIPGLIDGNPSTYFHTNYGGHNVEDPYGSYLEITYDKPITDFGFDFTVRQGINNGIINRVVMYAQDSMGKWVKFSDSDAYGKVLNDAGQTASFGSFHAPFAFTKMRFCVVEARSGVISGYTGCYWNAADIIFYGK